MAKVTPDSIARPQPGTLFLVATPIGNLGDLGPRAREVLATADLLLAEDTRHTAQLLDACGIMRPHGTLESLHEQNERARAPRVIERLRAAASVALVSDAGTPLVSDPGVVLVREAVRAGIPIVAVPGPCAAVAALTLSAMATDRFVFEGFLPAKSVARRHRLQSLATETRTLVFYEAPHRLRESLADSAQALGTGRSATVAREITKKFETTYRGSLGELAQRAAEDPDMVRGEVVIVVAGAPEAPAAGDTETARVLEVLLAELPSSQAAKLASRITGRPRKDLYEQALRLTAEKRTLR